MSTRTRFLGAMLAMIGAIALLAALAMAAPTGASEYLIQEEPERGATVAEAPHQLLLTFDRPLAQIKGAHHVEVTDGDGYRVDDGHVEISTYSQRTLIVPIHAEGDGTLSVDYRVLLVGDGEHLQISSSYDFTVDHSLVPIEGEALEAPAAAKSSQALVLWTIVILIGIAFAGGMIYFLRMATGNSRSSLEPTNRSVFRD
ncbi:MAG: copper resistance protein CopC [Chloroflexi bacterium]|nr:copper resistance protein CopC [Chloroflexota bacterium]MCY3588123.1 copper resistance protein CopC [Chloroflexota bacterium]MCY3685241.1 copper resistance protein CopC [Chloroflexota bacterium]MDE2707896.1 copper resistance protein CopC [Chloroflexota bacterium]MYA00415.1 copper resistance protein CopC [Chloroflexota bacterium]